MNYSVIRIILTVALCFSCNLSQAITKNIKEYHVNGNVYCIGVKEYSFFKEFGKIKRGNQISEHYTYFLQNGNVFIDSLVPNKKYKRYVYDENNRLKEEMLITVGAGRKIEIGDGNNHYNDTTDYVLYEYTHSLGNNEVEKYRRNNRNLLELKQKILYWKNNGDDVTTYFKQNGNHGTIEKEVRKKGNTLTIELWSDFNGELNPISISKQTLNNDGFPVKMSVEAVGGLAKGTYFYKYDEHNNVISEIRKEGNAFGQGEETLITRKYEYDNYGNWVRQLEFKNGVLKTWTERVIYYANSASDYTKVVEQDKQVTERQFKIYQKEKKTKDSIDNVAKEEAARKKQYEDSIKAVVAKLDVIIEKEMLQKHIMGVPQSPFDRYNINMKLRDTDGVIKSFNIMGSTIHFTIKKVKTPITVDLLESRIRKYYWAWNEFSEGKDEFQVGFTSDFNDIVIARPFLLLLHKEDNEYKAYTPDPKITNLSAINNSLKLVQKEDLLFLREYFQLFWNPNKGSVADQYKESTSEVGNETSQSADNHSSVFDVLSKSHSDSNSKVYGAVDKMPQFPGGPSALIEYLSRAVRYPAAAEANGIQGRVMCSFVVEPNGSISNVKVIKGVDPSLDKEAIRVISSMPKWIPGMNNGTPVRVNYSAPVTFRLQ